MRWKNLYFKRKAQAILELAIFGSFLISLLGILIHYGLSFYYQQEAKQRVFRSALASAASSVLDNTPTSTTHYLIEDRHIPSPSDPFGMGSFTPVSASAAVVRNFKMHHTADNPNELPRTEYDIQGKVESFPTAKLPESEEVIAEDSLAKYKQIYGSYNVEELGDGPCLKEGENPQTGQPECVEKSIRIKVIDDCAGEIVNYDEAVSRCRQIVDSEVCREQCSQDFGKDCVIICSQPMRIPAYCADYTETDPSLHTYTFPHLNQLAGGRKMGMQEGYNQTISEDNQLEKKETNAEIKTTDTLNWQVDTERVIVTEGGSRVISSSVSSDRKPEDWETKW